LRQAYRRRTSRKALPWILIRLARGRRCRVCLAKLSDGLLSYTIPVSQLAGSLLELPGQALAGLNGFLVQAPHL